MPARFIRLVVATPPQAEEMFVRPETIMAFGNGPGFAPGSWITLWGTGTRLPVRETCQEIAALLVER